MDSNASFNVAAKHLFRHLHEPRAIRSNPLVRRFFENSAIGGLSDARERAVLDQIHRLVRQGAEDCRHADLIAGKDDLALRQYTIVKLQCLERRPIREVAAALGISYVYCYRLRANICRRIGRYICDYDDAMALDYLPECDEFQLFIDVAMRRASLGSMNAAFRECNELVCVAPSAEQKVEALRASALVSLYFGSAKGAEDAYSSAKKLFVEDLAASPWPSLDVAQAAIDLMASRLAYFRADSAEALRMAQRASLRLEAIQANAAPRVKELYVESLFEMGAAFANLGKMERGYQHVVRAETSLCNVRIASSRLRSRIMVGVWTLRNYLLMSCETWYPSWKRLKGFVTAFEHAYASGSLFEAAAALVALTEYYASVGNDAETLRTARFAVSLVKQQPSERIRAQTSIRVAIMLLTTPYLEYASSLLPSAQQLDACDAYHRELVSYFAAEHALRLRRFSDALILAKREGDRREFAALTVCRRLVAAAAAHELERRREAGALIEAVIPAAERFGSVPILRDTYNVAAKVTGNRRFKRQASELSRLLAT